MEKALLSELLEGLTAFQTYLSQDLAKEKLSFQNQKSRHLFIQQLSDFIKKIQSVHPSVRPNVMAPVSTGPPPVTTHMPPTFKPPPVPPPQDEGGDVYEAPDITSEPEPSGYTCFQPVTGQEEPQEEYLAMEAEEKEIIEEETYEDPSQATQENDQGLYEDPQASNSLPLSVVTPPPNQQTSPVPPSTPKTSTSDLAASGYMDPVMLRDEDKRKSLAPSELVEDWEEAYDKMNVNKKKMKVKVSNLKDVLVKGWLEKLGGRNRTNWQKRFCALSDPFMYFYEKESSATYNNRIAIPGFVSNPCADLTKPKRNHFAFKLSSVVMGGKSKDYYFRAKTEKERDDWVMALRTVFERSRVALEQKKSQTLPANLWPSGTESGKVGVGRTPSEGYQAEEYEALAPVGIEEEEEEDDVCKDQDEYVAVTPANNDDEQDQQEEYIEVDPTQLEEPQEDYIEADPIRRQMSPQPSLPSLPPLPPPPAKTTSSTSITSSISSAPITQQPIPAPRKLRLPDPVIDTKKIYIQENNGVQYNCVYVLLWDFEGIDKDEMKLNRGDLVLVSDPSKTQEWWYGELLSQDCSRKMGSSGLFPASYCTAAFEVA